MCDARASRVWLGKYFAQNSLSAPTQVFQECLSGPKIQIWTDLGTPRPDNSDLDRSWHFRLSWYGPPPHLPKRFRFGQTLALSVELVWTAPPVTPPSTPNPLTPLTAPPPTLVNPTYIYCFVCLFPSWAASHDMYIVTLPF